MQPIQLRAAKTQADRELFQRDIDATDTQIDALVYALYELTEDEISVVEGRLDHDSRESK